MTIFFKNISTPLGVMHAGATPAGICFVEFTDRVNLQAGIQRVCKDLSAETVEGENEHLQQLEKELAEYFSKKRKDFSVALHLTGTEFQKSVWQSLLSIPYGKTRSYKQQALALGKLPAIRAVAATNGQNKHAIVIPCHRVLGSNGRLTGYAAGLHKKEWLLKFEMDPVGQTLDLPFE